MPKNFQRTALYAGTYDPITWGHLEIIGHAAKLCDKLIVGVAQNAGKLPVFTPEERIELIRHEVAAIIDPQLQQAGIPCRIEVMPVDGLTAKFMQANNISISIRGIRGVKDFNSEEELAMANTDLFTEGKKPLSLSEQFTQILIYTTDPALIKVSSSTARTICANKADDDLNHYVSPHVRDRMIEKMEILGLRHRDL